MMSRRFARGWAAAAGVLVAALANTASSDGEPNWGDVAMPSAPPARAIGGHARGCIAGAVPLPLDGPGYQVMRPSRNRFYGHPITIEFLREFAAAMRAKGREDLLVGDLGQPRGGPMLHGHRSHQTGLDIDIWFRPAPTGTLSPQEREEMSAISMVDEQGTGVDPMTWTADQVELLRTAAGFPQVDRIFVNAAIKQDLCTSLGDDRGWLAKIRPWWGHDHHFHIGLGCPEGEASCIDRQPPVPAGDGCDATLAWWFSEEAKEELRKLRASPPQPLTLDDLPPECRSVLAGTDGELIPASDGSY
jgi:penicillin-insensitive murein DD-endopeptidase